MLNFNDLHDLKKLVTFELYRHLYTNDDYARNTTSHLMEIWRKLDQMINSMEGKPNGNN